MFLSPRWSEILIFTCEDEAQKLELPTSKPEISVVFLMKILGNGFLFQKALASLRFAPEFRETFVFLPRPVIRR